MGSWWLRQIGIDGAFLENWDAVVFAWQRPWALAVGLPIVVPIGLLIWFRQRANMPSAGARLRTALTVTRVLVLLLLVLILAEPFARLELTTIRRPILAILVDHSWSMNLPVGRFDDIKSFHDTATATGLRDPSAVDSRTELERKSRGRLAYEVLQHRRMELFTPLKDKFEVRFYTFGAQATAHAFDPAAPTIPPFPGSGDSTTRLGDALTQVLGDVGGGEFAGLIVIGDGENTGGSKPTEVLERSTLRFPLLAVPVGSSAPIRDVSIIDVSTSGQVTVGDQAKITAVLRATPNYQGKKVVVTLRDRAGKDVPPLDSREVTLLPNEEQPIELLYKAVVPGPQYLTVEVSGFPDEDFTENNRDTAFVRVGEEKLKVLYIEGLPRWDFRFLKNALRRDPGIAGRLNKDDPDIVLEAEWRRLSNPADRAKLLPRTLAEIAEYHTIVIGDASPELLTPEFLTLLDQAVRQKGVGLVLEAGPRFLPHGSSKQLLALLPVELRPHGDRPPGERGRFAQGRDFVLELAPDGITHEVMALYEESGRSQSAWGQMLPFQWCADVVRPLPGATVLARNAVVVSNLGKMPLIVTQRLGAGQVLFVGMDATWLWRQNVADRFFAKFWGQGIRFVARRDETQRRKSTLEVQPIRPEAGRESIIELHAYDTTGRPLDAATQTVRMQPIGAAPVDLTLTKDPNNPGRYLGRTTFAQPGDYLLSYSQSPGGAERIDLRVRVPIAPEELRRPEVNRRAFAELVAKAGEGSAVVELPNLAGLESKFRGDIKTTKRIDVRSLWDNWIVLSLLVFIFSLDVGLRRLAGLS